ncbi:hypothetical protein [Streptomyces sp. NPDC059874]|uniref:hypothetical protein n=1 Tax=Streptomyces sp. NPDC059874 TaxID=3346983 RepID=UPI003655D8A8
MEELGCAEVADAYRMDAHADPARCTQGTGTGTGDARGKTEHSSRLERGQALLTGQACPRLRNALLAGSAVTILAGAMSVVTR